jgi:hypothetical protein
MRLTVRLPRALATVAQAALGALLLTSSPSAHAQEGPAAAGDAGPPVTPPLGDEAAPARRRGRPGRDGGRVRRIVDDEEPNYPTMLARDGYPIVGFHQDRMFLRDPSDTFRLFPGGLLQFDTRGALGRGVSDLDNESGGAALRTRASVRRARLELGGQIHGAWSFLLSGDFAGERAHVEYALVDVQMHRMLHVTVGQQLVPFTMENRTHEASYIWMERPLAVRFAQASDKDLGAMAWGETRRGVFSYEAGFFGGDGINRPSVDDRGDAAGRFVVKPLAWSDSIARNIHFGASATYGMRELANVGYAAAPLATDGGFVFWDTHTSQGGQRVDIRPSGRQLGLAGEFRIPISRLDLRLEFMYVNRNTRESFVDAPIADTLRLGRFRGTAFYGHLGFWLLGRPSLRPEPGRFRPPRVDFNRGNQRRSERGLELAVKVESISATYERSARDPGAGDAARTCGDGEQQCIDIRALGVGLNYYATRHAAVMLNYSYYVFPDSSIPSRNPTNAAVAPGNLNGHTGAHQLHELGGRVQVFF